MSKFGTQLIVKSFAATLLCMLAATASAQKTVKIGNEFFDAKIDVARNGKITSFKEKDGNDMAFSDSVAGRSSGIGKHRTYEDKSYFDDTVQLLSADANKAVMKIAHGRIEMLKTISLPPGKKYLKVEFIFKDTIPVEGKLEIAPWIHNTIAISGEPGEGFFYLPHEKGIRVDSTEVAATYSLISSNSNWMAYVDKKTGKSFIVVTDPAPTGLYYWCSPASKMGTLEFHYPQMIPVPDYKITCYFLPGSDIDSAALPVKLNPQFPAKGKTLEPVMKQSVDFNILHEKKAEKRDALEIQFWQPELVLSPDVLFPYALGIRGNIRGKDPLAIIDVPEGLEIVQACGKYWRAKSTVVPEGKENIKRGDINYTRFKYKLNPDYGTEWQHSYIRIFFKATKGLSANAKFYYCSSLDGILFPEKSVPVKVVNIPQSQVPRKFMVMMNCDYEMMKSYPDWEKNLKYLGINGIALNYNVPSKELASVDEVREVNDTMRKAGFITATMGAGFFEPPHDKNLKAVDINGNMTSNFDFTARGPFMDDVAAKIENMAGAPCFDIVISDYEAYFNGYKLSYTERTLKKFEEYFRNSIKDLVYIDPKTMTLNKEKYPEHYKIWVNWKSNQFHEYLNEITQNVRKKYPDLKIGFCTTPGVSEWQCKEVYLQDNKLWNNTFLDYNMQMIYNNVYGSMNSVHSDMDIMGKMQEGTKGVFVPVLSFGFWGNLGPRSPAEDSKYMIYEAVTSGAKGYWVWPGFVGGNGWNYAYMAQANKVIAENENAFLDGCRMDGIVKSVKASHNDGTAVEIKPKVIVYKDVMLLYIAEYSGIDTTVELILDIPYECEASDAESGEKIGKISDKTALQLKLCGKEKGKMIIIRNPGKKEFQGLKENRKEKKNVDTPAANTVLSDSFDEEPLKGKASGEYPIFSSPGGVRGNCLKITDYRGVCIYDQKLSISSGNVTVDLWFKPNRNFSETAKTEFSIFSLTISDKYIVFLQRTNSGGRLQLIAKYKDKYLRDSAIFSEIDKWNSIWYNVKVSFGKDGASMWIDEKLQGKSEKSWPEVYGIERVQLGSPFRTFGFYDELKIYDGTI